jgi:hypothetical protein
MADDWEQFSKNPYRQQQYTANNLVATASAPFLMLDWPDLTMGLLVPLSPWQKAIYFDLTEAQNIGLSGREIEKRLNAEGIIVHTKALYPEDMSSLTALIVVDKDKFQKACKILTKMGVVLL